MAKTRIEWTESTWNPVTGCTRISPGCRNCYAERLAKRLKAMGQPNYANGFELTLHEKCLDAPLKLKQPQMIFVNSMSDLFHQRVPLGFIERVFGVMSHASHHVFQALTKRTNRLKEVAGRLNWTENIWMGASIENADYLFRMEHLRHTPASVKFISFEPLIGPVGRINLEGIDWVIVGGESGPHSRPVSESWIIEIKEQCVEAGVSFFFKQWGGFNKKKNGRLLQGRVWDEMPDLRQAATA